MASNRALRLQAGAGVLALMALAALAQAFNDSPRLLVLCLLAASFPAWLLWRALARLAPPAAREAAPTAPLFQSQDKALVLEARLEHAPVALFLLNASGDETGVAPMNANARQLLAPGRVVDPASLFALLAAQPASGRALIAFDSERGSERAMVAVSSLTVQGGSNGWRRCCRSRASSKPKP